MTKVLDSIWGAVTSCVKIAPEVYMVDTARPDEGASQADWQQGGIMILAELADCLLPERAISFGTYGTQFVVDTGAYGDENCAKEQDFLQFGNDGAILIPLYELLSRRYITDYEIIRSLDERELLNAGRFRFPEYFGELIFPLSLYLRSDGHKRLDNGIWAFRRGESAGLCVHRTVAAYSMSLAAVAIAKSIGNSFIFPGLEAAIALHELSQSFQAIHALIPDSEQKKLLDIIKTHYKPYYAAKNKRTDNR